MAALTATEASLRDKMFKDVKFWVAHRIPMREYFINKIKEGGGIVVPLEKNADMLIADHVRKDAPAGSYSWKFIEDSVKHGIAQLKDRYAIGPDPTKPRPVASAGPTRGGRTEFTAEDDAMLVKWVLSHNQHRTGNIIYQQLEKENPRHTWQSWQNRWRKKLQHYTQTQLIHIANSVPESPEPQAEPKSPSPLPPQEPPSRQPQPPPRRKAPPVTQPRPAPTPAPAPAPARHQPRTRSLSSTQDFPSSPEPGPSQPPEGEPKSAIGPENPKTRTPDTREPESPVMEASPEHARSPTEPINGTEPNSSSDSKMDQFYDDLQVYIDETNADIDLEPTIGNQQFTIWELAQAVGAQKITIDEVDWALVAHKLGYDDYDETLLDQLLQCWEDNLREFVAIMEEFQSDDEAVPGTDVEEDDEQTITGDDEQIIPNTVEEEEDDELDADEQPQEVLKDELVGNMVEDDDDETEPQLPSLPPSSSATKKRPPEDMHSSVPNTYVKRRRLDPDAVIQSTPESKLGIPTSGGSKLQPSPSLVRSQKIQRLRRLDLDDTIKDSQDDTQDRLPSPLPAMGARSPELGSYEIRTPVLERIESAYDISPSEQLESEAGSPLATIKKRVSITVPDDGEEGEGEAEEEDETSNAHDDSVSPQPAAAPLRIAKKRNLPSTFRTSSAPSVSQTTRQTEAPRRHFTTTQRDQPQPQRAPSRPNPPSLSRKPSSIPEWAEHYESLGYPRSTVNKAMLATTMNPGSLVVTILESLSAGKGIPPNHAGIWTDRDDKGIDLLLHAGNDLDRTPLDAEEQSMLRKARKEEKRLLDKHGELWTKTRKQFWVEKKAFEEKKRKNKERKKIMRVDERSEPSR